MQSVNIFFSAERSKGNRVQIPDGPATVSGEPKAISIAFMREKGLLRALMSRESGNLLKRIGDMLPVRADSEHDKACFVSAS